MPTNDLTSAALALLVKATVLSARWARATRRRALGVLAVRTPHDVETELAFLRDRIDKLELQVSILRKNVGKHARSPRYSLVERLHVLWFMELFQIPRRNVTEYFGIARSTLYRWLRRIDDASPTPFPAHNRTPNDLAALVWEVARANLSWGRVRIANQLALLGVFLAASTVRSILSRAKPPAAAATSDLVTDEPHEEETSRSIPASFANHVWSVDCTSVLCWGLWPTNIFLAIDHFSRKVVRAVPLEGPNAAWICNALETAFRKLGPPRHIISDKGGVFGSAAVQELLCTWGVKHRFGAVGKHGSIAVTKRVIWTLKYEWLFRVPLIKGFDHLERLCEDFGLWYNGWRPHARLAGARPDDFYGRDLPELVAHDAKVVPATIERRHFAEARVTGFRLPRAA